jgi:hypothetical protein
VGFIADVVANTPILSSWANDIRDRVKMAFASVAERDAQWPAAPRGAHCTTIDTMSEYIHDGTAWQGIGKVRGGSYIITTGVEGEGFAGWAPFGTNVYCAVVCSGDGQVTAQVIFSVWRSDVRLEGATLQTHYAANGNFASGQVFRFNVVAIGE